MAGKKTKEWYRNLSKYETAENFEKCKLANLGEDKKVIQESHVEKIWEFENLSWNKEWEKAFYKIAWQRRREIDNYNKSSVLKLETIELLKGVRWTGR